MNIEILKPVIKRGYKEICNDIQLLVMRRIEVSSVDILADYITNDRAYVERYCSKYGIDLVEVLTGDEECKVSLGLRLIENEIMSLLGDKSRYDTEIKSLGISPVRITNGIENCGWLALMNSPNNLAWFVKRTDKFIEAIDPNNEWYDYIVDTISNIKDNWIDPQNVKPDIEMYHALMALEVDEPIKDLLVK
ncbi:MAG: hypothetical protein AAGE84_17105 [Cyanobacteria bacterium P01_G01_bin.39]